MTLLTDAEDATGYCPSPRAKMKMLEQMAEALEDEAAGLYRRAAAYEEEEFLITREIGERQAEINRLLLKVETLRGERNRVIEKIESIAREAAVMREEVCNKEEDLAVAAIQDQAANRAEPEAHAGEEPVYTGGDPSRSAVFFRRMALAEDAGRA